MEPHRIPPARSDQDGFVLVGVVMFVLALTILGLSLFALSSFESQFINQSSASGQALYAAESGLEHAKFVLSRRQRLADVGTSLFPTPDIAYARAARLNGLGAVIDSTGMIDAFPAGTHIELRVLANVNGERRMLSTQVTTQPGSSMYKRLITATQEVRVIDVMSNGPNNPNGPPGSACGNTQLSGEVYDGGGAGAGWPLCAPAPVRTQRAGLPTPDVASFIAGHIAGATPLTANNNLWLSAPQTSRPAYFKSDGGYSPPFSGGGTCSMYLPTGAAIDVTGWVVWMCPHGFRADGTLQVQGHTANDCLVIVAGSGSDPDNPGFGWGHYGIDLSAGIKSPTVPVILVTDQWVFYEHWTNLTNRSTLTVNYLSMFASAVSLWPPGDPGNMILTHNTNSSYDAVGNLIDQLCDQGALPNSDSGRLSFKSAPGTWQS